MECLGALDTIYAPKTSSGVPRDNLGVSTGLGFRVWGLGLEGFGLRGLGLRIRRLWGLGSEDGRQELPP